MMSVSSPANFHVMTLTKNISPHLSTANICPQSNEFTVFGFYDRLKIDAVEKFDELLSEELAIDILTRKVSLYDSNANGAGTDTDLNAHFRDKITLTCMAKLNARIFLGSDTPVAGSANAKEALQYVCNKIKAYLSNFTMKYSLSDNFEYAVFFSLSIYDIILFIHHPHPNIMAKAFLGVKQAISELAFSTSFFVIDFTRGTFEDLYMTDIPPECQPNVGIQINLTLKQVNELGGVEKDLISELSPKNHIFGYTPGDTDVVFASDETPLINVLNLYSKLSKEGDALYKELDKVVKSMQSCFAFFKIDENNAECVNPDEISNRREEEGLNQFKYVHGKFRYMCDANEIPASCQSTIENFFQAFVYLYRFREHHDAVIKFLQLMNLGLDTHKNYLSQSKKNTSIPELVDFVFDLYYAIRNLASAGTIYLDRMLELHPMNSYAKLFYSYEQIACQIFDTLPHCEDSKVNLRVMLMMNRNKKFACKQYFRNIHDNTLIAGLEVPHPLYFGLRNSIVYLLHEISHFHQGGAEKKAAYARIALGYVAIEMQADNNSFENRAEFCGDEHDKMYRIVSNLFDEAKGKLTNADIDLSLSDILGFIVGIKKIRNAPTKHSRECPDAVFNVIMDFARENYSPIEDLECALNEAVADILMLELAYNNNNSQKMKEYASHFRKYFSENFIDPLYGPQKKVFAFIRRCFFVSSYYGFTVGDVLAGLKLANATYDNNAIYGFYKLAEIFNSFMEKLLDGENLFEKLNKRLLGKPEQNLVELELCDEVKIHLENWHLNLKKTAERKIP